MKGDLHSASVIRAIFLSVILSVFSFYVGTSVINPEYKDPDSNSSHSLIVLQKLEENIPLLFYTHVLTGIITNVSDAYDIIYRENPIFSFRVYQFDLLKNPSLDVGEKLNSTDTRLETEDWVLNPIACCNIPIERVELHEINEQIQELDTSLFLDLANFNSYSNVTGNPSELKKTIAQENIGKEYWEIFHFYRNNDAILIQSYGFEVFISFLKIDHLTNYENGFVINYVESVGIHHFGQFRDTIFPEFSVGINEFLDSIF